VIRRAVTCRRCARVRKFHSSASTRANGDVCVAFGFSGDVIQAMNRAREAKRGVEISYSIPKEGALFGVDVMAIPSSATNVEEAHAVLDYVMRPAVAAQASPRRLCDRQPGGDPAARRLRPRPAHLPAGRSSTSSPGGRFGYGACAPAPDPRQDRPLTAMDRDRRRRTPPSCGSGSLRYGAVGAVDGVSLEIRRGEVIAAGAWAAVPLRAGRRLRGARRADRSTAWT
jgi:hypothetical protein